MYRLAAAVATSGALGALLVSNSEGYRAYAGSKTVHVELQEGEDKRQSNWDSNWDRRAPQKAQLKDEKEGGEVARSTASRHLILIRHGQYEHWHSDRDKKVLTELGRSQARVTGTCTVSSALQYGLCV